jgi:anti-sigma factor RsiW
MLTRKDGTDDGVRPEADPHEEFLVLCSLAASGDITEEEGEALEKHLATCTRCREAVQEFQHIADDAIPALASDLAPELSGGTQREDAFFNVRAAEASFLKRLSQNKKRSTESLREPDGWPSPLVVRRSRNFQRSIGRVHFWLPLAAATVLCVTLGILTYRMEKHRGVDVTRQALANAVLRDGISQETLAAAIRERDAAVARLSEREKLIAALKREMAQRVSENTKLKALQSKQEVALQMSAEEKGPLSAERDRLAQEIASSQTALQGSEDRLRNLEKERTQSMPHTASLEAQVAELSRTVTQQQKDIAKETELLSKDKDIRELMGARDLYVVEVIDVEQTGETQKAFGRVFYTRGKSLIFYAYDVDEKPGWRNVNSIQAWGMRGPDQQQAVNLGMFYEDNLAKKRWVLKFDDTKTLSQIDGVFVTLEPRGGSDRPSRKPFMFAYLKMGPNHP